jgi:hypothetical protein
MSARLDDIDAVARVVQLYIDGAAGDAARLREAFHPDARMFGHIGALEHNVPISTFIDMVAGSLQLPAGPRYRGGGARRGRLSRLRLCGLFLGCPHRRPLAD